MSKTVQRMLHVMCMVGAILLFQAMLVAWTYHWKLTPLYIGNMIAFALIFYFGIAAGFVQEIWHD